MCSCCWSCETAGFVTGGGEVRPNESWFVGAVVSDGPDIIVVVVGYRNCSNYSEITKNSGNFLQGEEIKEAGKTAPQKFSGDCE